VTQSARLSAPAARFADRGFARLELIQSSFRDAARASGDILEEDIVVAGAHMRLRSASAEMVRRLWRAFGHLEAAPSSTPDLTISMWDSASEGTAPPPLPNTEGEEVPGAFFYYNDEQLQMGYQLGTSGDARLLGITAESPTPSLSALDHAGEQGWYWVEDAQRIPSWDQATPMPHLLDWWLRDHGGHLVHAGAVGTPEGGAIIVGKSGSGKSTTTLSALQSDLLFAGDEYVGVSLDSQPHVYGLYNSGRVMPDHVQRLPFLLQALANSDQLDVEKALVYAHEQWPANTSSGFPLRAIIAPRVTPGLVVARITETSPVVGFTALAPNTVFQMHTRGQDSLMRARRLVEIVPSYMLELGSDMASIPRAISGLLEQLNGRG
jgi:hypothetical protein